jgi:L-ribulose-5-phosphate 4-epimerase
VVHTHSEHATTLAQARLPLRCMGTTHADHFRGDVPVTRPLTEGEVADRYEENTGLVIVEAFRTAGVSPEEVAAVLVSHHGPFTWGPDAHQAVENARILEYLARMEIKVRLVAPDAPRPGSFLVDAHYLRKHGKDAYYGQKR